MLTTSNGKLQRCFTEEIDKGDARGAGTISDQEASLPASLARPRTEVEKTQTRVSPPMSALCETACVSPVACVPATSPAQSRSEKPCIAASAGETSSDNRSLATPPAPVCLSTEQREVLEAIVRGQNVLVLGGAGSGKSTLIAAVVALFARCLNKVLSVTSTTGASLAPGGTTFHYAAGIGRTSHTPEALSEGLARFGHMRGVDALLVDEASMLDPATFLAFNAGMRRMRQSDRPFGGLQVILMADFLQLPPVHKPHEEGLHVMRPVFVFDVFHHVRGLRMLIVRLTKNFRQAGDEAYTSLLARISVGRPEPQDVQLLLTRKVAKHSLPANCFHVHSHADPVKAMNKAYVESLPGPHRKYEANLRVVPAGPLPSHEAQRLALLARRVADGKVFSVPSTVTLAVTANVYLAANVNVQAGYVNGRRGTIVAMERFPVVQWADNGQRSEVGRHEFVAELEGCGKVTFSQVPLQAMCASTVHGVQGKTLPPGSSVALHLGGAFAPGQAYVALSRSQDLGDLHIVSLSEDALLNVDRRAVEIMETGAVPPPLEVHEDDRIYVEECERVARLPRVTVRSRGAKRKRHR